VTRTHQPSFDPDSQAWLDRLTPTNPEHDSTMEALRELLLEAARFEIQRRRTGHPEIDIDCDDLAQQAAADALVHLLDRLGEFRGQSRFTSWAMKFAIVEAGIKARRRAWRGREVPLEPATWAWIADDRAAGANLELVATTIRHDLSRRQRQALVATTINGVPIDVAAEHLDTTRGALSKTIHAARRKLRAALAAHGLSAWTRTEAMP
jgi:RNA polymerase sigma-70 factor (ECF subfamily)